MPIPFALMAAGTALQVFGQYKANMDQADAEMQNAQFYGKEADFALESQFRQSALTSREYEYRAGAQTSAYAKGGVDVGSGSAATTQAATLSQKMLELNAIEKKGNMEFTLARLRQHNAENMATTLRDPFTNILQGGTTVLTNAARYSNSGGRS